MKNTFLYVAIFTVIFSVISLTSFASSPAPTTYPGCSKPDVILGKQTWASCDVNGSFVFGTGTEVKSLNLKKYNPWKSKWNEKDQWVCSVWYHIPTQKEWKNMFSGLSCKLGTGTMNKNQMCGKSIISQLDFSSNGVYWTSSENTKNSAWKFKINLNLNEKNYGYSILSTDYKSNIWSIRCIKN